MRHLKSLLWLLVLFGFAQARAEVTVLVHGYLGSDRSWMETGIVETLQQRGHTHAGIYFYALDGIRFHAIGAIPEQRPVYTVNLPSTAPLILQADWLAAYLHDIGERHPGQSITLVGHSAGGLVARLYLVRHAPANVGHLITIATPHQGTQRAIQALSATSSGGLFGPIKRWAVERRTGSPLYHLLRSSRGVLFDMTPPRPGNLLFWLNSQPHPAIRYTSIIRVGTFRMPGDQLVPPLSQDLRLIAPVADIAHSYSMAQGHLLTPQDGHLLANLLDMPLEPAPSAE